MVNVGENWLIDDGACRWLGKVVAVEFPNTVTLSPVSWVSESGRLSAFFADGRANGMEVEYLGPESVAVLMMRTALKWPHPLIEETV